MTTMPLELEGQAIRRYEAEFMRLLERIEQLRLRDKAAYSDDVRGLITEAHEAFLRAGPDSPWREGAVANPVLRKITSEMWGDYLQTAEVSDRAKNIKAVERELRFYGELPLVLESYQFEPNKHRRREVREALEEFEKYQGKIRDALDVLSQDRYMRRWFSAQERYLLPIFKDALLGFQETFEQLDTDEIYPYRQGGKTLRERVLATEVADLCLRCFGACSGSHVQAVLQVLDPDTAVQEDDWFDDRVADAKTRLEESALRRILIDYRYPLLGVSDGLRPFYGKSPWLS